MVFVYMHIFFSDFLHFDMSRLLLTVTLRGVSNKHCLLLLFSFELSNGFYYWNNNHPEEGLGKIETCRYLYK